MSTRIDGDSLHTQTVFKKQTISAVSSASNATYTAAQVIGGIINRDPNGANRTDTTPTAAQLVAEMQSKNSAVTTNSSFPFLLSSDSNVYSVTVAAGTGVTLVGSGLVRAGKTLEIDVVATNIASGSEAVSIYVLTNYVP